MKEKIIIHKFILFIIIALVIFLFGFYYFMSGIHSIDLAWNSYRSSRNLIDTVNKELTIENASFKITLENQTDIDNRFTERTLEEVYILGFNQMVSGFVICLSSIFIIGFLLGILYHYEKTQ